MQNFLAIFANYRGSADAFAQVEVGAAGLNPTAFATYIHQHGYGIGTPDYVAKLVNVIDDVSSRLDCGNINQ